MTKEIIKVKIMNIITETLKEKISIDRIGEDDLISDISGLTSLEAIEIVAYMENEFGIEIEDENLTVSFISTINNLATYICNKIS